MKTYCKGMRVTHELVIRAYRTWLAGESGKQNAWRIVSEYGGPAPLIDEIVQEIRERRLTFRPILYHYEYERNGKLRRIGRESVKQQIVDYVVICALTPLYDAKIGFYQVASIKGKGPIFGAKRIQDWIQEDTPYVHGDITKCYESFNRNAIYRFYIRYVKSRDLIYTIRRLLSSFEKGLGIGSAFSLKTCQFLLSFAYHMLEDACRTRRGVRHNLIDHQIWYADDFYLFSKNKSYLKIAMTKVEKLLKDMFGLTVKPWKICNTKSEPVDFAGYVVRKDRITIRSSTYLRIRKNYARFDKKPTVKRARTVCSYWGNLKNTNSHKAVKKNQYDRIFRKANRKVSQYDKAKNS